MSANSRGQSSLVGQMFRSLHHNNNCFGLYNKFGGANVVYYAVDLSFREKVDEMCDAVGTIDILVNNAGLLFLLLLASAQ